MAKLCNALEVGLSSQLPFLGSFDLRVFFTGRARPRREYERKDHAHSSGQQPPSRVISLFCSEPPEMLTAHRNKELFKKFQQAVVCDPFPLVACDLVKEESNVGGAGVLDRGT